VNKDFHKLYPAQLLITWWISLLVMVLISEVTLRGPWMGTTSMGDRLRKGKLSQYVINHPDQLSLAIRPWLGAMNASENWGVSRYTTDALAPIRGPAVGL